MPGYDAILNFANKHNIHVIEDAAEVIGSEYKGRKAGSLSTTGVFSFHGSKTLTTGEGGLLTTHREDLFKRAQVLRDHGRLPGDLMFFNSEVAYKYKMSSMQAALGLAHLERVDELINRKRLIFDWYRQELKDVPGITLNAEAEGTKNTCSMVSAIIYARYHLPKAKLIERFSQYNIDSRPFFHALSSIPANRHLPQALTARQANTISYAFSPQPINLPSGLTLTQERVQYVCMAFKEILTKAKTKS